MYCAHCGKELQDHAKFCAYCGKVPTAKPSAPPPPLDPEATINLEPPQDILISSPPQQSYTPPPQDYTPPPQSYAPPPPPQSYTPPPAQQSYTPPPPQQSYTPPDYAQFGYPPAGPPPAKRRIPFSAPVPRWLSILLGTLAGLFLLIALFLFVDPFNLNLLGRLTGNYDAIAEAMPADTQLYMSVNLLNINQENLQRLQSTFQEASDESPADSDLDDLGDEWQDLVDELDGDWGLTLENDVMPWIGQYAGVGVRKVRFNSYGEPESADVLLAIEIRNIEEADAFVQKLVDAWGENEPASFEEDTYQDVVIYEWERGYADPIAFGRAGNIFYLGNGASVIRQGIDAQSQDSLADQDMFRQAADALPRDRGITFVLGVDLADSFIQAMDGGRRVMSGQGLTTVAAALTLIDEGVRLDSAVTYDPETMSESMAAMFDSKPASMDSLLPPNTIAYQGGYGLDLAWQALREAIVDSVGRSDFTESMDMFEDEFGFNPDEDLFPLLNGPWTFALLPSDEGAFAEEMGVDLGWAFMAQTADAAAVDKILEDTANYLDDGWIDVDTTTRSGQTVHEVLDGSMPMFAFGMDGDYMTIASSYEEMGTASSGGGLDKEDKYKQVWRAFPRGMTPMMYLDVTTLVDTFGRGLSGYDLEDFEEVEPFLEPFTAVAGATKTSNNTAQQTIIVFIDMAP